MNYRVVGNCEDTSNNILELDGTASIKVLSETTDTYDTLYTYKVNAINSSGVSTTILDVKNEPKTVLKDMGTSLGNAEIGTYWGKKVCNKYDRSSGDVTQYIYADAEYGVEYETVVMQTVTVGTTTYDLTMIWMLKDTDYIVKDKTGDTPDKHSFEIDLNINGTYTASGTSTAITGTIKMVYLDFTGTSSKIEQTVNLLVGTQTVNTKTTEWYFNDGTSGGRGTYQGTQSITTSSWGVVPTKYYQDADGTKLSTSYYYKDLVPVKLAMSQTESTYTMVWSAEVSKFVKDNIEATTLDQVLDWGW